MVGKLSTLLEPEDGAPQFFNTASRVIFDHLPKTGGMAINQWLTTALGDGCVSPNIGAIDHRSLIAKFGGTYSVLTAHVNFGRQGMDPRYQYVTLLREPIDRVVSWLYFIVNNNTSERFGEFWHVAKRFIESGGDDGDDLLHGNFYVKHFASIDGVNSADGRSLIDAAVTALERYDVWGIYEEMPEFLSDFGGLLGVQAPARLQPVNVTRQRPALSDLSDSMRARIVELNSLDIEFYSIIKDRYAVARSRWIHRVEAGIGLKPMRTQLVLNRAAEEFTIHSARVIGGETFAAQGPIDFDVAFSLARPAANLKIGLVMRDEVGARIFSTNSTALGRPIGPVASGSFRTRFTFMANLPDGRYTLGLQVVEELNGSSRYLAAFDELARFQIGSVLHFSPGPTTFHLPTTIHCEAVPTISGMEGWRLAAADPGLHSHVGRCEGGSVVSDGRAGFLLFGPYKELLAGRWRAIVEGSLQPDAGYLKIEVASFGGRVVHVSLEVTNPTERVELDFQLDHPVRDLEVRVWIHEFSCARIDAIAIEGAVTLGNDVSVANADCNGFSGIIFEEGDNNGSTKGQIPSFQEARAAGDPTETEVATSGFGCRGDDQRADGAAARSDAAVRHAPVDIRSGLFGESVGYAPFASVRESVQSYERAEMFRMEDTLNAGASRSQRAPAENRLTHWPDPTFSIVIATDGRSAALGELLDVLPFLEGPPFEVCVVRGPTEDGIADVLAAWEGRIKSAYNPIRNLSLSRNIGIAMAAGEIIAFLDDDAIPEPSWLVDLAEAFHDPSVACAGGLNRDCSGVGLQYGYATANRMGQARWDSLQPTDALCKPGAPEFPYTQGTNTAIRRTDLEALGGFDEEYEFYLDETDLCCRLVDVGRTIRQLPRAIVYHRSLPSDIRTSDGVTHSLYSVLKNKLYFSLVNNHGHHTPSEALVDFDIFVTIQERRLRQMAAATADGPSWIERFVADVSIARAAGINRGSSGLRRLMSPGLITRHRRPFLPLTRRPTAEWSECSLYSQKAPAAPATINNRRAVNSFPELSDQRDLLRKTWADLLPSGSRVALANYPDHQNVGDPAIWLGTRSLLQSLNVTMGYGCDPWSYDPDRLARAVPRGPILLIGGGNLGDVYNREQKVRTQILQDFPDRPIIQLPQSTWFRSPVARDALAAVFAMHGNTTLLLRDAQSLAFARAYFPVRSLLCPDAALALEITGVDRQADVPVVALWRRDVELDLPLPPLPPGSILADWQDNVPDIANWSWNSRAFRAVVGDPPPGDSFRLAARRAAWRYMPTVWDRLARERLLRGCRLLARGRVVITNRLHAHLLCILLRIPHVVCDTVNGKLSAYRDTWETNNPLVRFASTPDEAVALAETLVAQLNGQISKAA
jgi:exopolysaccharide biosynthesis predicted pyruvyltransferase EpsI/GT2 family glycosyltransferase